MGHIVRRILKFPDVAVKGVPLKQRINGRIDMNMSPSWLSAYARRRSGISLFVQIKQGAEGITREACKINLG